MNSSAKQMENAENAARSRPRWRRGLAGLAGVVVLVYSAVCLGFFVLQDRLVFKPEPALLATPARHGLAYEDLHLRAPDGTALHAWYVPGRPGGREVLLLHGNAGNISRYLRTVVVLNRLGHGVLAVDYRGFGRSGGQPSELGAYQDAATAYDYLVKTRGVAPRDIVVYGRSLGGAVATWLATHRAPGGLVLESTFTRLADVGADRYPWLPVTLLSRYRFDSLARIGKVRCPILVSHGRADSTVPERLGRALAAAAGPRARFVSLPGDHSDAFLRGGVAYERDLEQFIRAAGRD